MKLRNKKTGEIKSIREIISEAFLSNELDSLKNIDANWEEIISKEPLIKDEKVRKAVRAWSEVNNVNEVVVYEFMLNSTWRNVCESTDRRIYITILKGMENICDGEHHTISELCGEE